MTPEGEGGSAVRPATHGGEMQARDAVKPPPWACKDPRPVTSKDLKAEYNAMVAKKMEDEIFSRKLNLWRPPPEREHIKKDWRYYQHVGSKGNLWNDLYHTPDRRRPLVVTPTVIKGFEQQARKESQFDQGKVEDVGTKREVIMFEREQRRFQIRQKQHETAELQLRAGQRPRPASSHVSRQAIRPIGGGLEISERIVDESGDMSQSQMFSVPRTNEVPRPASAIVGKAFENFEFTTLLPLNDWSKAIKRRDNTRTTLALAVQRPDMVEWAEKQAENKAVLEVQYEAQQNNFMQDKRQERRRVMALQQERRQKLQAAAGQIRARSRLQTMRPSTAGTAGPG